MKYSKYIVAIFLFEIIAIAALAQGTWTQKPTFPGLARYEAVGFSIGNKGYIGTGLGNNIWKSDFWEYDPTNGVWTQKADYEGGNSGHVSGAVGFSIGNKGYIGTGWFNSNATKYNDFWEYDPATNNWTQKANLAGAVRRLAFGFSIGTKGYIGGGNGNNGNPNDMWEYNQNTNIWTLVASNIGATGYFGGAAFSIGNMAYIGESNSTTFWAWNQTTQAWTQKATYPGNTTSGGMFAFAIGSCGFMGTGGNGNQDFWMYDTTQNIWSMVADFAGGPRESAVGFSILSTGKGYAGTGLNGSTIFQDFWEYAPDSICITNIHDVEPLFLPVFPNPSTGKFFLSSKNSIEEISIYNLSGERVFYSSSQYLDNSVINISDQPDGIYLLHVKTAQGERDQKLVIHKE